jgi:hypothetical protein
VKGETRVEIARDYNVNPNLIGMIDQDKVWSHVRGNANGKTQGDDGG